MKIYLTLNHDKDKDKAIIDYLEQQYSKSGTIKSLLYQVAVNDGNIPTITANSKEEKLEQKTVESSRKINLSEFLQKLGNQLLFVLKFKRVSRISSIGGEQVQECILITTIDGNTHRFDKKHIENYELFKDNRELEELFENTILVIEIDTRKVSFMVRNIIKFEVV